MTKISLYPTDTSVISTDLLPIVDVTNNQTKKVTVGNLATALTSTILPSGIMLETGASAAPTGWLLCDGSAVSRSLYPSLFTAIGTVFGTGDGSTTFNVPDMRGRVPVGVGTATGANGATAHTLGQKAGEETHALSIAELAAHNHGVTDPGHTHVEQVATAGGTGTGITGTANIIGNTASNESTGSSTTGITTQNNGSGTAHNVMQPYIGVNYIIKT